MDAIENERSNEKFSGVIKVKPTGRRRQKIIYVRRINRFTVPERGRGRGWHSTLVARRQNRRN